MIEMPYTSELIKYGTVSWPKPLHSVRHGYEFGRESTVLRASAVFFGIYDPKEAVEYNNDQDWIDYIDTYLGDILADIDKELLEDFRVLEFSPEEAEERKVKRDYTAWVTSMAKEEKKYKVKFGNLPRIKKRRSYKDEVLTEFMSFLNYKGSCWCESHEEKGEVCSMPKNYFDFWYGHLYDDPIKEYDRIQDEDDETKPYGSLFCKHQVKALVEDNRFPHIFNKFTFYSLLPAMVNAIRDYPREGKKLKIGEMDNALKPILIDGTVLGKIPKYLKKRISVDYVLKDMDDEILRAVSEPKI